MQDFYNAIKERRSIYNLSDKSTISDEKIIELVENALLNTPSSFNSQSSRVAILFNDNHKKLWDIVNDSLKAIVPAEKFAPTESKIKSFSLGYGTILYFEDMEVVSKLQQSFPTYKDNFPIWSNQTSGILQYIVWTSLAVEKMGASLQHYNPIIDDKVKEVFNIPNNWKLIAQMPFGVATKKANDKTYLSLKERMKIFK